MPDYTYNPPSTITVKIEVDDVNGKYTHEKMIVKGDILQPSVIEEAVGYARDLLTRARNARDTEALEFYGQNPDLA